MPTDSDEAQEWVVLRAGAVSLEGGNWSFHLGQILNATQASIARAAGVPIAPLD